MAMRRFAHCGVVFAKSEPDWILPNHSHCYKLNEVMSAKKTLPVFSYTKMETGPPLSAISSQFAWAGQSLLPDLVQEQSDRLLRRLERPRTAENRLPNFKNSQMRGSKLPRPASAVAARRRVESVSAFGVNGIKVDIDADVNGITDGTEDCNSVEDTVHNSSDGERSSSPDFMADLYKEYERKIASDKDGFSSRSLTPTSKSPPTKLLRRPSAQSTVKRADVLKVGKSDLEGNTVPEFKIHCVIKLPTEQADYADITNAENQTACKMPTRQNGTQTSDMWIDLSRLHLSSDEEAVETDVESTHSRSNVGDISELKFLDLISQDSEESVVKRAKKHKSKRPGSSKNPKHRPHSKRKKRRSSNAEESTKEVAKSTPPLDSRKLRNADKLREEIETQMSILDTDRGCPTQIVATKTNKNHKQDKDLIPRFKQNIQTLSRFSTQTITVKPQSPLKKVPIQILSDPFRVGQKMYQNQNGSNVDRNGVGGFDKVHRVPTNTGPPAEGPPMLRMTHNLEHLQSHLKTKGMVMSSKKMQRL